MLLKYKTFKICYNWWSITESLLPGSHKHAPTPSPDHHHHHLLCGTLENALSWNDVKFNILAASQWFNYSGSYQCLKWGLETYFLCVDSQRSNHSTWALQVTHRLFWCLFLVLLRVTGCGPRPTEYKEVVLTVPSARAEMTLPSADRDLLMFLASSSTAPSAPVLLTCKEKKELNCY